MKARAAVVLFTMVSAASSSWAEDGWELTLLGGWTAPAIEERVVFDVDVNLPEFPGTTLSQEGDFGIVGRGTFAFGGTIAYYFNDFVGLEARLDTVDFQVDVEGPRIVGSTPLPPPLRPLETIVDLSAGAVNVERLYPLSANLKLRTGGPVRFVASGGVSFLPRLRFSARQEVTIAIRNAVLGTIPLATAAAEADALSDVPAAERFGVNGGAGLELQLSDGVAFVGEARVFSFPTQTLSWRPTTVPETNLDSVLLDELLTALEPVELDLTYFQVSGGLVFRF